MTAKASIYKAFKICHQMSSDKMNFFILFSNQQDLVNYLLLKRTKYSLSGDKINKKIKGNLENIRG